MIYQRKVCWHIEGRVLDRRFHSEGQGREGQWLQSNLESSEKIAEYETNKLTITQDKYRCYHRDNDTALYVKFFS